MQNDYSVFYTKANLSENRYGNTGLPVMAYVEMQKVQKIYDSDLGLSRGTIFEQLDKPFLGGGACD